MENNVSQMRQANYQDATAYDEEHETVAGGRGNVGAKSAETGYDEGEDELDDSESDEPFGIRQDMFTASRPLG